jgi:anti-sigma factor RsiW
MHEVSRKLVAYMDGELAENETVSAEDHLTGCSECRERLAAFEEASRAFARY